MLQIPQGSIYPALHRLERRGWVAAEWGPSDNNRNAKYYELTKLGRKAALGRVRRVGAPHDGGSIRPRHEVAESAMVREFWNDIRYRVRALVRRDDAERALNAEIEDHLARHAESLERAGWSREDARRQARLAFGGLEGIREHTREAWGTMALESTMQDMPVRDSSARRNRAFACSGILVLALGIAAVTVVFSIVYGVLLRDLPYDQPDRLVTLGSSRRETGFQGAYAGVADYFDWREQQQVFDDLGLTRPVANYNLTEVVSPNGSKARGQPRASFRPCACDLSSVASIPKRNNSTPQAHRASPC
jgi:DNA-binding PadR family transcriptional regulator